MRIRTLLCCWSLILPLIAHAAEPPAQDIVVLAASSLTNTLSDLASMYEKSSRVHVVISFAASSMLAKQIEAGARVDIFLSADDEWMDYLQKRDLIDGKTRRDLVGNQLVLIAAAGSKIALKIEPNFPLAAALGKNGRLATGDPDSVPVGRYARAALTSLGVWNEVADRLARAENVRAAMTYVARGEAPLGIVYTTDALVDSKIRILDTFPENTHAPITYPAALTPTATSAAARFLEFLQQPEAMAVFHKYGFSAVLK